MLSTFRFVVALVTEIKERSELPVCPDDNVSAVSSGPAIGSAFRNEFFPPEADRSVATVTRFDEDGCLIDELHMCW